MAEVDSKAKHDATVVRLERERRELETQLAKGPVGSHHWWDDPIWIEDACPTDRLTLRQLLEIAAARKPRHQVRTLPTERCAAVVHVRRADGHPLGGQKRQCMRPVLACGYCRQHQGYVPPLAIVPEAKGA